MLPVYRALATVSKEVLPRLMRETPMRKQTGSHERNVGPASSGAPEGAATGEAKAVPDGMSRASLLRPALMLAVLVAGMLLLREVPGVHALLGDTVRLRQGVGGRLLFCLAGAVWCLFGLPRQLLCFAAGVTYGLVEGTALATLCTVTGSVGCFFWARWGGREWVRLHMERKQETPGFLLRHLGRVTAMLQRHPFEAIVILRLLPVGSSLLLNLFAGVTGVAFAPFAAATLVGSLPQTVIFVLLGSGAQFGGMGRAVTAIILFIVSGWVGYRLLRRVVRE
ncbi:TVP38/TMEM64 family protein [Acetobacter sp. LMG 1627]|uniref:TVP38/TMEM64 family membrane protein n=2 Tax=Acetobacter conturbans TaxID=1737472 RepID=A0ABX0K097_9PROT|nr:TVP38/TMEM64 family protein [Acetobacter conturbans]